MKAVVSKKDLLSHRKRMKLMKPPKKMQQSVDVIITASEDISITYPGFRDEVPAKVEEWGTVSLPYNLWENIIEKLIPAIAQKEIAISVDYYSIEVGGMKIKNNRIEVTRPDKVPFDIPVDAEPMDIVRFALAQDMRIVRNSVAWRYVKTARDQVRSQFQRACTPLGKYGITTEDLVFLVTARLGIENKKDFFEFIFPPKPRGYR